jgi:N-acetylglucosaminyldiphosphoundecaprenol N-acetyl-beta-D-mannosaminyltransferase
MLQTLADSNRRSPAAVFGESDWFSLLGVRILNTTSLRVMDWLEEALRCRGRRPGSVFFVNAHTLNLAASDAAYRATLNGVDLVLGDGTGVRWGARLQGIQMAENINGTDFVPQWFRSAEHGHSYFLLGAAPKTIAMAADFAQRTFPGWTLAGCHHGYLSDPAATASALEQIHEARPDVLLVGMGNPIQEQWIERHRDQIDAAVCLGVGGLFDFWAGNVRRAPRWLRRLGHEWLWRLYEQPGLKARRYLIGNPLFLARVCLERWRIGRGSQ